MDTFALIIFGITSNLAQIKIIPALYDMEDKGLLPSDMTVVGLARKPMSEADMAHLVHKALHTENRHHTHHIKPDIEKRVAARFHYVSGEVHDPALYTSLGLALNTFAEKSSGCHNRIFYLATYPDLYQTIFDQLKTSGLNEQDNGWVRVMIEKPIGNDLKSSKAMNHLLTSYFDETQIYRLDHYLGKETLQNILSFRFANDFVEPLLTNQHIDHIQVSTLEDFGIGARGGYYDSVGALKDVGQNHLLQMIAFACMNTPLDFTNETVTRERLKILQALAPLPSTLVLGQYEGYRNEPHVASDSLRDTYFAFKTEIRTKRFGHVPIYVRGGKYLAQDADEITFVFKKYPGGPLKKDLRAEDRSALIFRLEPNEAIVFKMVTKKPGHGLELEPAYMQYCYRESARYLPDPYEKLIADAMRGEQTFFNDAAEVETQWAFIDQLVKDAPKPSVYARGSWGPPEAVALLEKDGRAWLEPSMAFCTI